MKQKTYIAMLIDASSSMSAYRQQAIDTMNSLMKTVVEKAKEDDHETYISTISFSNRPTLIMAPTLAEKASFMAPTQYLPNGMTAMYDAVEVGMKTLIEAHKESKRKSKKAEQANFLVLTITDGQENASMSINGTRLASEIKSCEAEGNWTFAFSVPRGDGAQLQRLLSLSPDNIKEWEVNAAGLARAQADNNAGLRSFMSGSAKGQGATRNFYEKVTTDASTITARAVKKDLEDLTDEFKLLNVADQDTIKPFVEAKMKREYQIGTAFYMLMKKEKIQPQKDILLLRRTDNKVFGGQAARDLIGLPEGAYANVTPGNHGEYDIFVQSTSTNRILPRGTKVLVKR